MTIHGSTTSQIPSFGRDFFGSKAVISSIGHGQIGGKAHGLLMARDTLRAEFPPDTFADIEITIPKLTVVTTDVFEAFIERNNLREVAMSDEPDRNIAHAFQLGETPPEVVGDLRALIEGVRQPLAVRSSSLLEDALFRPFAGVYETKMTPNNQLDADERFRRLVEALKLVWSSTFFSAAKRYIRSTDRRIDDEKMAVIIQEVVGHRHGERFYPELSGVARSYNFYPAVNTRHEEGVVNLALGLGKQVVDGGLTWFYPPTRPRTPPPFASPRDQMKNTQTRFWAVNMGRPAIFNPTGEAEYLVRSGLPEAAADGTLKYIASTYDPASERIWPGASAGGPHVLNFEPLLDRNRFDFNDVITRMLKVSETMLEGAVEIEFAMTMPREPGERARLSFLQVRPMLVSDADTTVSVEELTGSDLVLASSRVIGNGTDQSIRDIVYVRPDTFDTARTQQIAREIRGVNAALQADQRPYVLIGFGRWGTSDPWLGIPVSWDEIAGARVIVEATLPGVEPDLSQGSHFFHNLISFKVCYLMVPHTGQPGVNWSWLDEQKAVSESRFIRHVRLPRPLLVMVDGRSRRGVIRWTSTESRQ